MRPRSKRTLVALLTVLAVVVAACGGDGEGGEASDTTGGEDSRTVIRFAFAPDPVWDYMNDNGYLVEWEEENNIRIVTSTTWDEFTFFAGGHGDVVSMGTLEIPVLEQETGIQTVTFGKYNALRDSMMTTPDTGFETLEDIPPGSTLCVASPVLRNRILGGRGQRATWSRLPSRRWRIRAGGQRSLRQPAEHGGQPGLRRAGSSFPRRPPPTW